MSLSKRRFDAVKQKSIAEYKNIEKIYCPYLNDNVHFNRMGIEHIKFKGWNRGRKLTDQYMRFKLLHLAPEILKITRTVQGISTTNEFVRKKVHSRWEKILTIVYYWEFVAILDDKRVRVVVRQVDGGKKHFWSIIPFWQNKNNKRKMMYKDPSSI